MQQGNNIILRLKGLDFASGSANIKTHDYALLNKVRDVIVGFSPASVSIIGHTDGKGKASLNKKLSLERAEAVRTYLEANLGQAGSVSFAQISGMGDEQPLASNKTAAGRAKNRRVDVTITPTGVAH
jgi:OOP family OmpA-OmpF porin